MGYFSKDWAEQKFGLNKSWIKAQAIFKKRGGLAIYLTRFLLTPLAIPTNLIAGSTGYSYWRFAFYAFLGECTWLLMFGGLGYTFGDQWEVISQLISDFSGLLLGLVALAGAAYVWWKRHPA